MGVTLRDIFEGEGYDFEDKDDLYNILSLLDETEILYAEVSDKIEELENAEQDGEE